MLSSFLNNFLLKVSHTMSQKFSLKWNDFHSNVSKSFGLFRNEDYLHDVTLVSDDHHHVSAHKLVLSACSEYFKNIFKLNNKPNAHPLVCLDGISSGDLKDILDYMYIGEVQIFQEDVNRFFSIAQRLKIEGLVGNDDGQHDSKEAVDDRIFPKEEVEDPLSQQSKESKTGDKVMVPVSSEDASDLESTVNQHIEKVAAGMWQCKLCGKTAKSSQNIKYHIATHLEGFSYSCQLCEKTFKTRESLRLHNYRSHK